MWLSKALTRVSDASARARDGLTSGSEPVAEWDDLVLPVSVRQQLRDLVAQVRERGAVRDQWGLGQRHAQAPVAALFHGPRGTGKTLAAQVVANALRKDLSRVDPDALLGRYLGETERHLRRAFDLAEASNAVLLLDEADGLFGKLADATEAYGRYAGVVNLLRPLLQAHSGLVIFATKREPPPDTAMLAHIPFRVAFPFPGARERVEIWRRVFVPETRTEGLDIERLAQLDLTGGQIKNIARLAAADAKAQAEPVRMTHVRDAVRHEYERLNRPTPSDLSGW